MFCSAGFPATGRSKSSTAARTQPAVGSAITSTRWRGVRIGVRAWTRGASTDLAETLAICIRSLPAVVIDGRLADCCAGRGPDEMTLTREIIGGHGTVR